MGEEEDFEKRQKSVGKCEKDLRVKKTYFYCAMPDASTYKRLPEKHTAEKYRLFEGVVDLGYANEQKIEAFKRRRKEFRV